MDNNYNLLENSVNSLICQSKIVMNNKPYKQLNNCQFSKQSVSQQKDIEREFIEGVLQDPFMGLAPKNPAAIDFQLLV